MLHPDRLRRISRRRRCAGAAVLVILLVAGVMACTQDDGGNEAAPDVTPSLPEPEIEEGPTLTIPEGFVQLDTRGVRLAPVVARPKGSAPPIPVYGGRASITGVVEGPDGPVGGATVRIERWVGGRSGAITVQASEGGTFGARGLRGGRYRIRAWLEPSLTATESEVVFLDADGGSANVTVTLTRFEGLRLQASLSVSAINVDDTATVRGLLTRAAVDSDGIVVGEGVPGARILLTATPGLAIEGDATATTDGGGLATWRVKCQREGSYSVSLTTEGASTSYTLPTCGPKPATTTTTPGADVPPFAVGEEFTVPRSAPLPPGTYVTFLSNCATTFEVFSDGAWQPQRREVRGDTITLLVPGRDFRPATGTDGCRYRRTA